MKITKELITKAKECMTAQELLALAKENDIELNEEQAEKLLAKLNTIGEVSDEELDNVAGGGCDYFKAKCPKCKSMNIKQETDQFMFILTCLDCGYKWSEFMLT